MEGQIDRATAERQIEQTFGFVPEFYRSMPDAGLGAAWALHRDVELADTAIDHKTKQLIGLAVASHIKCAYCIHYHSVMAKEAGATDEEMREALLMSGLTVTYSNSISGMGQDMDQFREDVARAVDHVRKQRAQGAQKA